MHAMAVTRAAVAMAFFVGALVMVTWRHSRALEALADLDGLRRQASVALAERIELERDIQILTSRQHVVPMARDELGMHLPVVENQELVLLPAEDAR